MRLGVPMWKCAAALIGAIVLAGPVDAAQGGRKLDRALESLKSGSTERVIVRSKPGRRAELKQALKACGPKIKGEHPSIDALTAELSAECIQHLVKNNLVDSVGSDAEVTGDAVDYNLTSIPSNTLRSTLGQSEYSTGAGIGVAVIDSGIAPLPAFAGRIVGFYDFTTDSVVSMPAHD